MGIFFFFLTRYATRPGMLVRSKRKRKKPRRSFDAILWLIAVVLLGVCISYIITDRVLRVLRSPKIEHLPADRVVVRVPEEKVILEHEDLFPAPPPARTPAD